VCRGDKNGLNVFVIPVGQELDLKKCARVSGNKSVEMIQVKELLPLTGYIRGGCSPVGMKKKYPTFFDETCILWDEIAVSAGARGHQMLVPPEALASLVQAELADLII
jgi:Cys-tRNA(Pro)/Cys-tRNA(Cys) deacylase